MIAAQITYQDVPAEVSTISAYAWRPGSRPVPLPVAVSRHDAEVSITFDPRTPAIVLFQRSDKAYLVDGPLPPAAEQSVRVLDRAWRRTVSGTAGANAPAGLPIAWVSDTGASGEVWPQCWWTGAATWDCMGVRLEGSGVAVLSSERVLSAAVTSGSTPVLRESRWARLVMVSERSGAAPTGLRLSAARPVTPTAQRVRTVRPASAPLSDVRVAMIGAGIAWVAGDSSPPGGWLEARGASTGPSYLPIEEVGAGSPLVPVRIVLDESRTIEATLLGRDSEPAGDTLVTTFRLIDPPQPRDSRDAPPRRVFVAETVADAEGTARVDGLGDADYELVAWHPRLGRASLLLPAGSARVTIHLQSPGIARGRVLAGGKPAAGVDVISVPDPAAYGAAQDPLDLKGGDARTAADGRFSLSLAPGGGGELRIGGAGYAVSRVPLPRASLPIVDLGDIELARTVAVTVALDRDSSCELRATGPIGRAGLQIVRGTRTGPGLFAMALPEEGGWEFVLVCDRGELSLTPSVVQVSARDGQQQIRLSIR